MIPRHHLVGPVDPFNIKGWQLSLQIRMRIVVTRNILLFGWIRAKRICTLASTIQQRKGLATNGMTVRKPSSWRDFQTLRHLQYVRNCWTMRQPCATGHSQWLLFIILAVARLRGYDHAVNYALGIGIRWLAYVCDGVHLWWLLWESKCE